MSSHSLAHLSLVFLLVYADIAYSKVHYITPSSDGPCPQNSSCLTLSQFAADSRSNETDISLLFLPGNHTLDQELLLIQVNNFSMTKGGLDSETVFVECSTHSGKFHISDTIFVSIKDLHFIGCGSNIVSRVKWLTITDSTFQDVHDRDTVLELKEVSNAIIVKDSFLSNSLHFPNITRYYSKSKMLNYVYFQRSTPSGVIHTVFSNISVINSKFMHNRADIGGALVAHNSSLYLARCTYSNNTANFGGVMVTSGSTVFTDQNAFINNTATHSGGVMMTYNDTYTISSTTYTKSCAYHYHGGVMTTFGSSSFDISNSSFTENYCANDGGVIYTDGSSLFDISDSSFTKNNCANEGGVIYADGSSSFKISNSSFTNNSADNGGVMRTSYRGSSSFNISNSSFTKNSVAYGGGVMYTRGSSSFDISNSSFTNNSAGQYGGVMYTGRSSFNISNSSFTKNSADDGGVMYTHSSSFDISNSSFTNNTAGQYGGVMYTGRSSFNISNSFFTTNSADESGGVISIGGSSSFVISNSSFTKNSAAFSGGVMRTRGSSSFDICNSIFAKNSADQTGGVMYTYGSSSFDISNSSFTKNSAGRSGGVMYTDGQTFDIRNSIKTNNRADRSSNGGVGGVTESYASFNIITCIFVNNRATVNGGIIWCSKHGTLKVDNSNFSLNAVANKGGGIIFVLQCSTHVTNSTFDQNNGSMYTFDSNLTFSGYLKFENTSVPLIASQEGGAITSFQSTVIFTRESVVHFSNNQASYGGAILATESIIIIYGETTIANNMANSSGGGISLKQSRLEIRFKGKCQIFNNVAVRGGGIHASSSTIAVYQPGTLSITNNSAGLGGGIYLQVSPKLYTLKNQETFLHCYFISFTGNHANYGGAVYVADDSNSGACSPNIECFIQVLALYQSYYPIIYTKNVFFSENTASEQGPNLFGGLLDRCIPSPFAEVYQKPRIHYSGATYLGNISNIDSDSISSQPVRICYCNSEHEPDCSYQPPTITVQKGKSFNVSLVAVDQVNHTVDANVYSFLSSYHGGLGEGQQIENVERKCTNLTFNVFSPHEVEILTLYPNGPCGNDTLSSSHVTIHFIACTCPVGFEPLSNSKSSTKCECVCDSALSPYITECNFTTSSVLRKGTNSWITYINDTDPSEYVIYPHCPFDYCRLQAKNISINFNLPTGADSQCAYNRTAVLCGACNEDLSLSLASSRCVPCQTHWQAVFVAIFLAAAIAGILLVTALLLLNMTVSVGLINGFIFYANIVSAGSAVFIPSSEPSFPSVFVAWLNLDIGIDVCFIDGLDAYTKTWLELAFPLYIISLVFIVIVVSEYSPRFAVLIGKRDPVPTLATLILLSYAKLLSTTITALSSAVLNYPGGEQKTVWLPDGNVNYFHGKHIPLFLMALLIVIVGLPYTILLFLWQWIVRAPRWKVFNWTRNTKLNAFITSYHVPHNSKYRYWTGLLLLVRVVLYIAASTTVSSNPQSLPLMINVFIGGLFLFKSIFGLKVYKNSFVDAVDSLLYLNLLALSVFSLYDFKTNKVKQTAVAYTSTIVTFLLFIVAIFYHVTILINKRERPLDDLTEYLLAPTQPVKPQVTYSVIEPPKRDEDSPDNHEQEITEDRRIITPPYTLD